jgi:tetratricopeptide (TPR) repeat protein
LKRVRGLRDNSTIDALSNLAYIWKHLQKYDYAEPLYNEILIYNTTTYGPDAECTINAMTDLGVVCYYQNKFQISKSLFQYCYDLKKQQLGENHPDVLHLLLNVANMMYSEGDYSHAEICYLQLYDYYILIDNNNNNNNSSSNSSNSSCNNNNNNNNNNTNNNNNNDNNNRRNIDIINCLSCLSSVYYLQEKYPQTEKSYLELIDRKKQVFGQEHIEVVSSLLSLTTLYFKINKFEQAEQLLLSCLISQKMIYEDEYHVDCLSTMNNLGTCYYYQNQLAKAEEMYLLCLEKRKRLLGLMHPDTLFCMNNLGM